MKRIFLLIALSGITLSLANAQNTTPQPQRSVKGQVLTSKSLPTVRLTFDKSFKYIGSQNFVLYEVANAEQHFFVDADAQGNIKRLYWIQFEGYLPSNTHTYNYKSPRTVNIGGFDFFADASFRNTSGNLGRPDSDGNRMRTFIESKGYRMASPELMLQRLVTMVDKTNREELMIIYMEDLTPFGVKAADLTPNGSAASRKEEMEKMVLEHAQKSMKIER